VTSEVESLELEEMRVALTRKGNLPRHVAIIMDGNGRWAARRNLSRLEGHKVGRDSVRAVVRAAAGLGLEVLTLYTFSKENWQRPRVEVEGLMGFLEEVLREEVDELEENDIRLTYMGRVDALPESTRAELVRTAERLAGSRGMTLNLALSYSSREEIVDACRRVAEKVGRGDLELGDVNEKLFAGCLYRPDLPDPDLLIRTSGEMRISNFLLWQLAYAEIYVTEVLWPDFRERDLYLAVQEYQKRERRFGLVPSDLSPRRGR
jgi:undecaprenyl diphosphate synthase